MTPGPARPIHEFVQQYRTSQTRAGGVVRSAVMFAAENRVQMLRDASMAACLEASDDAMEAVERCTSLSYELATAEQMLRMHKEDEARYEAMDTDSW